MRQFIKYASALTVAALLIGNASAQSMLGHAIAAGTGTVAGGAAGKDVSEGVSSVLGKLGKQLETAAKPENEATAKPKPAQATAPIPDAWGTASGSSGASSRRTVRPARQVSEQESHADGTILARLLQPPQRLEPFVTSAADLARIERGTPRADVVARLGRPAARIFVPEEGGLLEIYHYTAKGVNLGKVRLTNGTVTSVETAQ